MNDTERYPKIDSSVTTHTSDVKKKKFTDDDTTYGNPSKILLINWTLPMIFSSIYPCIAVGFANGRGTMHALQMIASEVIDMDTALQYTV